jgi:hypothetical protein
MKRIMKKIFLTLAIAGTIGIYTAEAQTQRGTTTQERQSTMDSDTTMRSPMEGQQDEGMGMGTDEDTIHMRGSNSDSDMEMQQDTNRMEGSDSQMGTQRRNSDMMQDEDSTENRMGTGAGADTDIETGSEMEMAEPDTIQFNEPIMDRKFKNERSTDPNRSRDNMKRSTDPNRTSGQSDPGNK